jgi:peptidyl-prolyl cis-trans isomerase SurA
LKRYVLFLLLSAVCAFAVPARAGTTVNRIVAVVNGERITMFDVERTARPEMMRRGLNPNNPAQRGEIDKIYKDALDAQINDILIVQEAVRLKTEMGESEVDKEVARILQQSRMSPADFEKQLQREGMDMKSLRERIRKGLLRQRLLASMVGRRVTVSKEEVARYYTENKEALKPITEVRMAILVYPPDVDAESITQRIRSGKLSFEEAVRQYSIDPATKKNGGRMAPAPWKDMSPDWRKRVAAMKEGEVSDIFPIDRFKAQMKLLAKVADDRERTLEETTPEIEAILREPLLQARYAEYTKWLRSRALVDIRGI